MLRIDISTLGQPELKRLVAAARARGQEAFAAKLEAELASRSASGRKAPLRRPPDSDAEDDETRPMFLDDGAPDLRLDLPVRGRTRPGAWSMVLAVAVLVGGAAGWGLSPGVKSWLSGRADQDQSVERAPAPRVMAAQVAAPASTPAPEPASTPAVAPSEPEPPPPPASRPAAPTKAPARPTVPARLDPCATPPTPADRALCNDLALNLLSHEMRDAYGQALSAGADPAAIRESQAAWRRTRDPVSDPRALAEIYDRRIRELKAAAAAAASRPPVALADRQQN
ncbi:MULTISPECIES: hypothetical protein [unclassified Phenylobacterium]|uniref:hypothetical protein n=1 Tax=unclassified Phenylobacterium TaxID=2640670 RepID=UPI00083B03D5|nr:MULTISPECIES: hypothetical protein [unclassified Phenylobacterium]